MRPMAIRNRDRRTRVPGLLFILAGVLWWAYCYSTPGNPVHVPQQWALGPPGTTVTDWREGTTSDASRGLYIDTHKLYGYAHLKGFAK